MALIVCISVSGCTVCYNAHRNQCVEPRLFNWKRDAVASRTMYAAWADRAWNEIGCADTVTSSPNYEWGFRDGFVEHCFAGGNGEPPAVPPRPFWNAGWRTGSGKQAADDWFAGYRHGAEVAREGGYRDEALIRSSVATASYVDLMDERMTPAALGGYDEIVVEKAAPQPELVEPGTLELPEPTESFDPTAPSPPIDHDDPDDETLDDPIHMIEEPFSALPPDDNHVSLVVAVGADAHEPPATAESRPETADANGHIWRHPETTRRKNAADEVVLKRRRTKKTKRR